MQKNKMIVPIITSVGVGAVTYYAMTKNNQSVENMLQQTIPLLSSVDSTGQNQQQTQAMDNNNTFNTMQEADSEKLGPFGQS